MDAIVVPGGWYENASLVGLEAPPNGQAEPASEPDGLAEVVVYNEIAYGPLCEVDAGERNRSENPPRMLR